MRDGIRGECRGEAVARARLIDDQSRPRQGSQAQRGRADEPLEPEDRARGGQGERRRHGERHGAEPGPERYARRAQGEGIARQASRDDVIAELAAVHVRDGRLGDENGETPFTQFILDAHQPGYEPAARAEDVVFKRRTQHRSAAGW